MDWKKQLINLADERANALSAAEQGLDAGNQADYDAAMERVSNLNTEIQRVQDLLAEQQKQLDRQQPSQAELADMAGDRGEAQIGRAHV